MIGNVFDFLGSHLLLFELSLSVVSQPVQPSTAVFAQVPGLGAVWESPVLISTLQNAADGAAAA